MERFQVNRGTTFSIDLAFSDKDSGAAVNISGRTLLFTATPKITDDDALAPIRKTVSVPTDSETVLGLYTFTLSPTETAIPIGEYFCNFRLIESSVLIDDTSTFIIEIAQGPTTRTA